MEPIVSRESIRDLARIAANNGKNVHVANPYPAGTAAYVHFEGDCWAVVREIETESDGVVGCHGSQSLFFAAI